MTSLYIRWRDWFKDTQFFGYWWLSECAIHWKYDNECKDCNDGVWTKDYNYKGWPIVCIALPDSEDDDTYYD